ncbi:hypothetical protein FOA52_009571 [Chlamydomonas sp. UWO 241]|nr:hypothetical protein FOA52_009571 [Chlamydomonas sp. UWO 241]
MEHPRWSCEGSPEIFDGGSWIGHVWPATIFLLWGLHWLQGLVVQYYRGAQRGELYVARSYYQLWIIPEMLESWLKFLLPWFCMLLELYLGHTPPTFKTMTCPSGTLLAGHLYGGHMGNWQHAFMYPGFIASGFADLFSHRVTAVPKGVTHLFLFVGFFCEALLFGLHKKHTPMDVMVHALLTYAISSCAFFSALEAWNPHSVLMSAGRVASMLMQSMWFYASAHVMYEQHAAWDTLRATDLAPVIYLPFLFAKLALLVVVGVCAAFLLGFFVYRPAGLIRRAAGPAARSSAGGSSARGDEAWHA